MLRNDTPAPVATSLCLCCKSTTCARAYALGLSKRARVRDLHEDVEGEASWKVRVCWTTGLAELRCTMNVDGCLDDEVGGSSETRDERGGCKTGNSEGETTFCMQTRTPACSLRNIGCSVATKASSDIIVSKGILS